MVEHTVTVVEHGGTLAKSNDVILQWRCGLDPGSAAIPIAK